MIAPDGGVPVSRLPLQRSGTARLRMILLLYSGGAVAVVCLPAGCGHFGWRRETWVGFLCVYMWCFVAPAGSVKRTIVTSSCVAIRSQLHPDLKVWTEDDWNTDSTLETGPYPVSNETRLQRPLSCRVTPTFAAAVVLPPQECC